MKPFDIEKARAGEPILLVRASEYDTTPVRLIGLLSDGRNVVERHASSGVYYCEVCVDAQLRMAPKKRTVYLNVHKLGQREDEVPSYMHDTEEEARQKAYGFEQNYFAIAAPIEIEE